MHLTGRKFLPAAYVEGLIRWPIQALFWLEWTTPSFYPPDQLIEIPPMWPLAAGESVRPKRPMRHKPP